MRFIFNVLSGLALVVGQATTSSNITIEKAHFFTDLGSKRVSISYGPYTVPPRSTNNGMKHFTEAPAQIPCADCLITFMQADLSYPNGTRATAADGLWLHHTVLVNIDEADLVCPTGPQRFFASGNERTPIDLCVNGTDKTGYYVSPSAHFALTSELMNMRDTEAEAVVSVTYEFIPSPPESFGHVQPVWLDIGPAGGCNGSDQPALASSTFTYSSPGWTADTAGYVVLIGSHMHNGGTHVEVRNNGDIVCDSVAQYGGESKVSVDELSTDMVMRDISYLSSCYNVGSFGAGSTWSLEAYYDTAEYMPMRNTDGTLEGVMGISLIYFVAADYVNTTTGSHTLKGAMTAAAATASAISSSGNAGADDMTLSATFTFEGFWAKAASIMGLLNRVGL